jgi:N-formylglutamate deformylase
MILHIPHSSNIIPEQFRNQIVLSDDDLVAELIRMTDAFTDELFTFQKSTTIRFPISRLLLDVERFADNTNEPMAKVGMGMIYTHTAHGRRLKRSLKAKEIEVLHKCYEKHHELLSNEVETELDVHDKALLVDCHSFPSQPLPCDMEQTMPRPNFCIGTDSFHTPLNLIQMCEQRIKEMGYSVKINKPYQGTLVPMKFYGKEHRVASIMIEINRSLYMDEKNGEKKDSFESIKEHIQTLLWFIWKFEKDVSLNGNTVALNCLN